MKAVAEALLAAESTRSRLAKVAALASALEGTEPAHLPFVARFLTGELLPASEERTLGVGGRLVFDAIQAVSGASEAALGALARRLGDLGSAAQEAMAQRAAPGLSLAEAETLAADLAETGARSEKLRVLVKALSVATPLEARYVVRALLGEMRIGAKEGIALDAVASAFERPLADVRAAAGLVSDIGELARLAREDRLAEASIRLGRPVGFMLATPLEVARGVDLAAPHAIEDKIDGIRAQGHASLDGVHLFARGKGAVTDAFPDVARALEGAEPAIVDGEIVVVAPDGRPRPFSALQPRLRKLTPDEELVREHPVVYLVYDLLWHRGESLLAQPFRERRERLEAWAESAPSPIALHATRPLASGGTREATDAVLDAEFDEARRRGFEGLVLKRLDAPYTAGVRGFSWLKVKKALATLDVVIVGAERGQGKRAGSYSDYTFAVRDGEMLKTIGKAYSGLTDAEIAAMTERLPTLAIAPETHGYLAVRPEIVLEVAFDGLQRSDRHSSGFALRFPRIARIRDDKTTADIDTIDAVKALFEAQLASGHREDLAAPKTRGRRSGRRPDVRQKSKQLKLFDDD